MTCSKIKNNRWNYWCNKKTRIPPSPSPINLQTWISRCGRSGGKVEVNGKVPGCRYPIKYLDPFVKCQHLEGYVDKKTQTLFLEFGISVPRECALLFPRNAHNGPAPVGPDGKGLGICSWDGGNKSGIICGNSMSVGIKVCGEGGCCCNIFGCNCNDCKGNDIDSGNPPDQGCFIKKGMNGTSDDVWKYAVVDCDDDTECSGKNRDIDGCAYGSCELRVGGVESGQIPNYNPGPPGDNGCWTIPKCHLYAGPCGTG